MKRLNCYSCGGTLKHVSDLEYICEYCNTSYTVEETDSGLIINEIKKVSTKVSEVELDLTKFKAKSRLDEIERENVELAKTLSGMENKKIKAIGLAFMVFYTLMYIWMGIVIGESVVILFGIFSSVFFYFAYALSQYRLNKKRKPVREKIESLQQERKQLLDIIQS